MIRAIIVAAVVLIPSAAASTITVPIDQPTIQAAVGAAVNGDTIIIRAGVYHEAVLIENLQDLQLIGQGKVRIVAPLDDTALTLHACGGLTLQRLRFEGPGLGLAIDGCNNLTVTKCHFQFLDTGIVSAGASGGITIEDNVFMDIRDRAVTADSGELTITHNKVQRAGFGLYLTGCVLSVSDNKLLDLVNSGVYVSNPPGDVDSGIVGNLIDRCGVCGVRCVNIPMDTGQFTIGENVIGNVTHTAIDVSNTISDPSVSGMVIENNSVRGAGTAGVRAHPLGGIDQCLFDGNDVRKVRGFGLDVVKTMQPTMDVTLSNNLILGAGFDGILTNAATVSGNKVQKCGRIGLHLDDFEGGGTTAEDHVTLTGNTLLGSSLFDLYNTSPFNTILPDNTIGSTGP